MKGHLAFFLRTRREATEVRILAKKTRADHRVNRGWWGREKRRREREERRWRSWVFRLFDMLGIGMKNWRCLEEKAKSV